MAAFEYVAAASTAGDATGPSGRWSAG